MSDEAPHEAQGNKRNNRKRKKSFLKNARKYAKKGHYGRGSHIEADTYQYFVRIMETYREGFDNDEDKANFVNNVFEQTENTEVNCSCNQVGCRVVEMLIPFANDSVLERFMKAFSDDIRPICSDRFATHVLEALVTQSTQRSLKTDLPDKTKEMYKAFTIKISKFLLNNMEDFIWDTYGNHVIRTCLLNLALLPKEDDKKPQQKKNTEIKEEEEKNTDVPEYYSEIIKDYAERLIVWPQFKELCSSELTSGFLQILLKTLRKVDKKLLRKYLEKFLEDLFAPENNKNIDNPDSFPQVFLSKPAMMILEMALQVAKSKMFTQIYVKCFSGKLVKLAKTRNTNFAVQKLLNHCNDKAEFEAMFDELADSFLEIVEAGHSGVILSLGQSCKRLSAKQGNYVQSIMKCFGCEQEDQSHHLIICLSRLTSLEKMKGTSNENLQKEKLNLHGTLILQLMLEFNKPIKIVNGILNTDINDLKNLFSNSMGSHIVDSYVKSAFVGEKSREKLVRKMKGTYQELASSKFGSRCFEALWNAANLKSRLAIMDELLYKDGAWSNSDHGKIISNKINFILYKRSKEEWKNNLNKTTDKTKEMFADVLK
ncbi:unnamed protein product [Brassicogethes aeneus]|uniref:Nucleolar protein 9 n=1 Tax=Brassicogethes aeneus TaxID=1431903 RepID=A0A9P0FFA1_BRAAE|nr:unnamed protein product [Brassicogethes aeneus]